MAARMGFPHQTLDLSGAFRDAVLERCEVAAQDITVVEVR